MTELTDKEFFPRLAAYLDDAPAEAILQQPLILKKLQDFLLSFEESDNYQALTIIRAWCRKIKVRLNTEDDDRIFNKDNQLRANKLRVKFGEYCEVFVDLVATLLSKQNLLPLACLTIKELYASSNKAPKIEIIEVVMKYLHVKPVRMIIYEIISMTNEVLPGMPILDPEVAILHPDLHKKLIKISPKENQEEVQMVQNYIATINAINNGEAKPNRNLLQFCDIDKLYGRVDPKILAEHPCDDLRKKFYKKAIENNLDGSIITDSLICKGLFDPVVREDALLLLGSSLDKIIQGELTEKQLLCLQCLDFKEDSAIFKGITSYMDASDEFTMICSWCRFLFHKQDWIRKTAFGVLKDMLNIDIDIEEEEMKMQDAAALNFIKQLQLPGNLKTPEELGTFIDTINNRSQNETTKIVTSKLIANIILNPYNNVKQHLLRLHDLDFAKYSALIHAVAIRDGKFEITTSEKLRELISAINCKTIYNLLPVLARAVFKPLIRIESDGSSLLRLPRFMDELFYIPGNCGFYDMELYEQIASFPLEPIINEWTTFKVRRMKPIKKGNDIRCLANLMMIDEILATDFLAQLDEDPYAPGILMTMAKPQNVMYAILMAILSAKRSNQKAAEICNKLLESSPDIGLKLAQVITEYGGECEMPASITEYVLNERLRRPALGFIIARLRFHQSIELLETEKILKLLEEKQPINVTRQLLTISAMDKRGDIGSANITQKDPFSKSFAFYSANLEELTAKAAISVALDDREAICSRAAATEYLVEFFHDHEVPKMVLTSLFQGQSGENPFTLALLRLLSIPEVRDLIPVFEDFVIMYLNEETSMLFCIAALYTLFGYEIHSKKIIEALTDLVNTVEYTEIVLSLLASFSEETLSQFDDMMLFYITDALNDCSMSSLICINRMLLIGKVNVPDESAELIFNFYEEKRKEQMFSPTLHTVIAQVFRASMSARVIFLNKGFLNLVLEELLASDNEQRPVILRTVSQFIYDYREAQHRVLKEWKIGTLYKLFKPDKATINFFLCFTKNNDETQKCFGDNVNNKNRSLLDKMFSLVEKIRNQQCPEELLELYANILNSRSIRNKVFMKPDRIKEYTYSIQTNAAERRLDLLESWLRVFITITMYEDSLDKLYMQSNVSELLLYFINICEEIRNNRIYLIFLRNLIADRKRWEGLKASITKECKENNETYLLDVFDKQIEAAQNITSTKKE